ncbi:MAG: hypothetical protein EAZ99_19025 [Alphaproteobacteria bacterium]|nr:MAG: hypothetical protein EAZ99_19025 [Alphaproteobacteria bacterium]
MPESAIHPDAPLIEAWRNLKAVEAAIARTPVDHPDMDRLVQESVQLRGYVEDWPATTLDGLAIQLRYVTAAADGSAEAFKALSVNAPPPGLEWPMSLVYRVACGAEQLAIPY